MKEKYRRYADVLDVVLYHLREGRDRDAAAVVDALPDEEVRSFCWFLALHVERDLGVLRRQTREHWLEMEGALRPSSN
jgi:hypothetical protein